MICFGHIALGYLFMKLYLLNLYGRGDPFPPINEKFLVAILKVVSIKSDNRGRPKLVEAASLEVIFNTFYDNHYAPHYKGKFIIK